MRSSVFTLCFTVKTLDILVPSMLKCSIKTAKKKKKSPSWLGKFQLHRNIYLKFAYYSLCHYNSERSAGVSGKYALALHPTVMEVINVGFVSTVINHVLAYWFLYQKLMKTKGYLEGWSNTWFIFKECLAFGKKWQMVYFVEECWNKCLLILKKPKCAEILTHRLKKKLHLCCSKRYSFVLSS